VVVYIHPMKSLPPPPLKVSLPFGAYAKGKGKAVPVLFLFVTELHAMKTYWGNGRIAPRILDLGSRWR
jgi:hypothetical protein